MPLVCTYKLPDLPPHGLVENVTMMRAASQAHRWLGELKGKAASIPNQGILIDTLSLQEARASSEIENIVTTQDQLFQASLFPQAAGNADAKEVARYREALHAGFEQLRERDGLLTNNTIIDMFRILKRTDDGFRSHPGTALLNERTGQHVYVPPQDPAEVRSLMRALEAFINDDGLSELDPLIKMAIIHHQFESIHPFVDGNGRVGRMMNVLYLCRAGLLEIPILYLSRHINRTKGEYYRELQKVRDDGQWEDWIVYMLNAVSLTAQATLSLVEDIRISMAETKVWLRTNHERMYTQDLLNSLFRHPYTRIDLLVRDLGITRPTASKYLELLTDEGRLSKHRLGRDVYFVNDQLVGLLAAAE
ncbi:Fic family protein [Qipengyuania qiaonensis]|uniref:Fic family protein n=1 Tax=Qipengyuania qiaonensis TaxID=2867240 RepID=A0ABS7J382_9SPHN|nr:Fic family protein [Qipengyuania qiaonensis]MBX7481779.1 Fic family protein [Qipengyuania qiaonensis]